MDKLSHYIAAIVLADDKPLDYFTYGVLAMMLKTELPEGW